MATPSSVGDDTGTALLSPRLLARLERLQLGTRRRLEGRFSGEHRSARYGSSLDFADYRDYHPGDDFRRIDYSLYARTDQLFIRLFEAEDDLVVRLVVDRSTSMGFHDKLTMATRLAAALGFVALTRRDAVSLQTFPPAAAPRRFTGRHGTNVLFNALSALQADGGTDLDAAVSDVIGRAGPPGLTVVISDLLSPSWETALDRLPAARGALAIVHVLAREELVPTLIGDLEIEDSETGEQVAVSLAADTIKRYQQETEAWLERVAARCHRRGIAYSRVLADDDVETVLLRGWRNEGLLR
jgi:uncharacterized protein (DUF58 family)